MQSPGQSAARRRGAKLAARAISGHRPVRGQRRSGATALALAALATIAPLCSAASITIEVQDAAGQPLADAAVYAIPTSGHKAPASLKPVEIEQKNRSFIPLVTVIQAGTDIAFPNHDTVRHHVYSFSPAKTFEIKLYSGSGKTEHFDKTGTVVIGCNIHDQMIAYVHVVPTPYFAKTDASGKARLSGLLPGKYTLKAWHYKLPPGAAIPEQQIDFAGAAAGADAAALFKLDLKSSAATN